MSETEECSCKFGRVLEKHDIASIERDLEQQWRSPEGPGLRTIAEQFNKEVLRTALKNAGEAPLEGEIENLYTLLTDEDASPGVYTQARTRLREQGLDSDDIESDFISYQTVDRHFKNCRGLSKEVKESNPDPQKLKNRVFALQNRANAVSEDVLSQLSQGDDTLRVQEPNVLVDITVSCEQCGAVIPIGDVIEGRGCGCFE